MSKPPAIYGRAKPRVDLPQRYFRDIGKIVARCAFLESIMQHFLWEVAEVDQVIGLVAFREPRAADRLQMILDLAEVRGIKVNTKQATAFKNDLTRLFTQRDLFAHGTWTKNPSGNWCVINVRGNHAPAPDLTHRSKRITPEGLPISGDDLMSVAENVNDATERFKSLREGLRKKLRASADKHPER